MSTADIMILTAPFWVLFVGMLIAFGVFHYNTMKGH